MSAAERDLYDAVKETKTTWAQGFLGLLTTVLAAVRSALTVIVAARHATVRPLRHLARQVHRTTVSAVGHRLSSVRGGPLGREPA